MRHSSRRPLQPSGRFVLLLGEVDGVQGGERLSLPAQLWAVFGFLSGVGIERQPWDLRRESSERGFLHSGPPMAWGLGMVEVA